VADISVLARLLNGAMRNVDLPNNTPVVLSIKVGGVTNTELTKAILDRLVALQNGSDVDATYHTHDGRYFTESELGSSSASSGSDLIGDDNTYSNFTPAAATVKGALSGIDSALSSSGGRVKVSAADTLSDYLNPSISAGAGLSKSILNPGADEQLDLAVNVDNSTIEINADALRVKDAGITNAKIATGIDAAKLADGSVSNAELQFINSLTSNAQDQLDGKVAKAGSSMDSAANITFSGGGEVLGLPATPSVAGAAASKAYVDAVALGLAPKKAVRVATLVAGTLASSFENGDVIDGITLATGDRILIKNQAAPATNGIYTVNASGAPTRSTDMDSLSPIDEVNGAWVPVQFGSQAGQIFVQYGVVATLGTDALNFEFYNPIAALIGGDMVTVTGSTITLDLSASGGLESSNPGDAAGQLQVKLDGATLTKSASGLKVSTSGISATELAADAVTTAKILNANVTLAKLATDSVDENKILASSFNAAGAVTGGGAAKIAVQVDASTIEISSNALRVKDAGITAAKLAADSVITAKILNANVTLAKLASDSVDENKIVSTALNPTLSGGSGSKLDVVSAPAIKSSIEIAGEAFSATTLYAVRYGQNAETAGRVYKADKDATTTDNFYAIGLVKTSGALSAADPVPAITKMGLITATAHGFTVGKPLFLDAAGALSSTSPSTANHAVVRVGMVKDANTIDINVQVVGIN